MKIWILRGDCNGRRCFDAEDSMNNTSNLYDFHRKDTIENWPGLKVTFISGKKEQIYVRLITLPLLHLTHVCL
jgi:hypothetical protein